MPVDWKQSVACSLHTPAFNHEDKTVFNSINSYISYDEELREQLDMHSMIITSLTDEPLQTADQAIIVIQLLVFLLQQIPRKNTL
uniref:Uncharacterized protein n=1 Tax=Periophthalmus magnuspinnatus TaxID=409849 RepID=A0A3B4BIC9_9GOBI